MDLTHVVLRRCNGPTALIDRCLARLEHEAQLEPGIAHRLPQRGDDTLRFGTVVAQPLDEGLDDVEGVAARRPEPSVHLLLEVPVQQLEGRRRSQCGSGRRPCRAAADECAENDDGDGVHHHQHDRERAIGERPTDHQIDVVEPVSQDRHPDRDRPGRQAHGYEHRPQRRDVPEHDRSGQDHHQSPVRQREPLQLLSFDTGRAPEAECRGHESRDHDRDGQGEPESEHRAGRETADRVRVRAGDILAAGAGAQDPADRPQHGTDGPRPHDERPAPTGQPVGGEQQDDQDERRCLWEPARGDDRLAQRSGRPALGGRAQAPPLREIRGHGVLDADGE
jgi:hypothetical protein